MARSSAWIHVLESLKPPLLAFELGCVSVYSEVKGSGRRSGQFGWGPSETA